MIPAVICILVAAVLVPGWIYAMRLRRDRSRQRILDAPFPDAWAEILRENLPPYQKLTPALQNQLHQRMQVFLAEKSFEGCGGLTLDDEIKVTIAAQACLLLLNRPASYYPRLRSVLVYPSTYVAKNKGAFGQGYDPHSVRLGESWSTGVVVLAWDSVKRGALNFRDGHNVTMHEFAHQLDQEDGAADGAPILEHRSAYSAWARTFTREYERLTKKTKKGRKSVMSGYGATNPAEFFAVATEAFFEKPKQLKKKRPELFDELQGYYKVDPLEWI